MKKTGRILSIVLSIAMLITSCPEVLLAGVNESSEPQSSYETSVDTYDANIVENNDENTIDDEKEAVIDNESANDSEVDSNDDSNSVTSGSMNAVYLYDNSSLHICDGTKVYISNFASYIPIGMHDNGVLSMTGEGTEINISTPEADTVSKAIHAYGNGSAQGKSPELKINDGATLSFTTGTTSETGAIRVLENSTAKVDLRGGNVVVNNIGKCNTNNPLLVANSIRYDDDATFVNSAMTTGTSNKLWIVSGPLTGTEEAPATYSYTGTNSPRFVAVTQLKRSRL